MKYEIWEILRARDDDESWVVQDEVRKCWKRRHRKLRAYSEDEIRGVNSEDLAYVVTLGIAKVSYRKSCFVKLK